MQTRRQLLATLGALLAGGAILTRGGAATADVIKPAPKAKRPTPRLTKKQRRAAWKKKLAAARKQQLARVKAYREAGTFPTNEDFPDERTPYFIDAYGTPCAVAYLMQQDGKTDDVAAIARADNHVKVMDVKDGAIVDWVLTSGLTQEEAALIQPSYDFEREPIPQPDPREQERQRIQDHLQNVLVQLKKTTNKSLETALDRLFAAKLA